MADAAAAGTAGGGFWSFFSWENASSIVNVLGFILLGVSVPAFNLVKKWWDRKKKEELAATEARIIEVTKTVTEPIMKKIEDMDDALQGSARTSNSVLETLEKINKKLDDYDKEFKNFKHEHDDFVSEQRDVNAKVNYMDRVFSDNLSFGTKRSQGTQYRPPHSSSSNKS